MGHEPDPSHFPERCAASLAGDSHFAGTASRLRSLTTPNLAEQQYNREFLDTFIHYLPGILILSWVFLIVRIVQGETLVGDRQFWITRPYVWHRLLAAKLLSVFVFFNLPLFIVQTVLLYVAKFPVMSSIPGLLYVHALFVFALVLPSFTIG